MTQLQIVCTLRTGTQERWRRLSQEVAGSRRAQFEASCRQAGITQVQVWLVQLPRGELLVLTMNTQEPQQALKALVTSEGPFECWLREQLQALLGWKVQEVLPVPRGDLLLSWGWAGMFLRSRPADWRRKHYQSRRVCHLCSRPLYHWLGRK